MKQLLFCFLLFLGFVTASDSGKIVWSSMLRKIKESTNLPSLTEEFPYNNAGLRMSYVARPWVVCADKGWNSSNIDVLARNIY